jgi:hypothetical protein
VISCAEPRDAVALAALLQSPPAAAWLAALAEPARGGYRRHLAWTMALLPIPRDWPRARQLLLGLTSDATPSRAMALVAAAYGLSVEPLAPLVEWSTG